MRTLNYESDNMCVEIPVHLLHEELKMARVAYSILDIPGVDNCINLLETLEAIMADAEED